MQANHLIFGVHVTDRLVNATAVQKVLSEYGCYIKTRIGLHDVGPDFCSSSGILMLETYGDRKVCFEMAKRLGAIEGVEVQTMDFAHQQ